VRGGVAYTDVNDLISTPKVRFARLLGEAAHAEAKTQQGDMSSLTHVKCSRDWGMLRIRSLMPRSAGFLPESEEHPPHPRTGAARMTQLSSLAQAWLGSPVRAGLRRTRAWPPDGVLNKRAGIWSIWRLQVAAVPLLRRAVVVLQRFDS